MLLKRLQYENVLNLYFVYYNILIEDKLHESLYTGI